MLEVCLSCMLAYHAGLDVFNGTIFGQVVNSYFAARGQTLNSECFTASIRPLEDAVNPDDSSCSPFPSSTQKMKKAPSIPTRTIATTTAHDHTLSHPF